MNPSCRLVFCRFPLSIVYSIVKVFLFVVTAALQGFAPPCFVCFMIKRNRVCIPAMKFQRELFALISYSSWCIPDRDDVFALFRYLEISMVCIRRMLSLAPSLKMLGVAFLSLMYRRVFPPLAMFISAFNGF